jgi:hypothetical protein
MIASSSTAPRSTQSLMRYFLALRWTMRFSWPMRIGTPASSVKRAKTQLAGSVREISGLVLNRMPQKPGSVADPYHFYYMANDAYGESYNRKVES